MCNLSPCVAWLQATWNRQSPPRDEKVVSLAALSAQSSDPTRPQLLFHIHILLKNTLGHFAQKALCNCIPIWDAGREIANVTARTVRSWQAVSSECKSPFWGWLTSLAGGEKNCPLPRLLQLPTITDPRVGFASRRLARGQHLLGQSTCLFLNCYHLGVDMYEVQQYNHCIDLT